MSQVVRRGLRDANAFIDRHGYEMFVAANELAYLAPLKREPGK